MGRELRRVPLDFDAPLREVWEGYREPEWRPCPEEFCRGGQTTAAWWLSSILGLISVLADNSETTDEQVQRSGKTFPHPYLTELPNAPGSWTGPAYARRHEVYPVRDTRVADLLDAIQVKMYPDRPLDKGSPLGRSISSDGYTLTKALLAYAEMDEDAFFICPTCKGKGIHPDEIQAADAHEWTEPPEGPGFQLWETTSEGSPITPVFETIEELCAFAAENCTVFADIKVSAEEWREMLDEDFVRVEMADDQGNRIVLI